MYFLSHSDFSFPLNFISYFNEHFYTWSFGAGAPNLDGILRILSRLPNILLFYISQSSLFIAYFYIFSITIISFASFFYFLKYFLKSQSFFANVILSLFFAINPVFLGNESKIGLVLGIAMLPIVLTSLKKYFEGKNNLYFISTIIALNISLIHPFIFIVNAGIAGIYWVFKKYSFRNEKNFWKQTSKEVILFLGLNAFIFFTLISVGTLEKASVVNDLFPDAGSINSLLNFANTNGLVNSFAFSKDILKDFNFYNDKYKLIYFGSAFFLYILIFVGYLLSNRKKTFDRKAFHWLFGASLIIQLLATGKLFGIDKFLIVLTQIPGGWAFRSPLKWQLYLPLFLFGACGILVKSLTAKYQKIFIASLLILFFGLNFYIGIDVYKKLLIPKHISKLAAFYVMSLENKTLLFVGSEHCGSLNIELNEILISKNVQVKKISQEQFSKTYSPAFNYVISCRGLSLSGFNFFTDIRSTGLFVYENKKQKPSVFYFADLYSLDSFTNLDTKADFISKQLGNQFYFTIPAAKNNIRPTTCVSVPFENLRPENIFTDSTLVTNISIDSRNENTFYNMGSTEGNIRINGSRIANNPKALLSLPAGENNITYQNKTYSFDNLILNGSFEFGEWQKKVGDCHNYDNNPIIAMSLNKKEKSDGEQSLQLEATRHIACSSIKIPIKSGSNYLLSFNYQSPNAKIASYYLGFNNEEKTVIRNTINIADTKWNAYSKNIKVPNGATSVSLYIYAVSTDKKTNIINRYDNFKFIEIPDLENKYYLVSDPQLNLKTPEKIDFELINPTKKIVHIKGATTPFFLAMSESYHDQWQLELKNEKNTGFFGRWWPIAKPDRVRDEYHYKLNGFLNAWYVDTEELCQNNSACVKNSDGSYDIEMVIEFWPQRWFYLGLIISGTTLFGCLGYLGYDFYKRRKLKKVHPVK